MGYSTSNCNLICNTSDCTQVLEDAASIVRNLTFGTIYLRNGDYNISRSGTRTSLNWTDLKNVNIIGENKNTTRIIQNNSAYDGVNIRNGKDLLITQITFDTITNNAKSA